ncbi:MAG: hypothetical protein ACK415_05240 [Thermodesulfovibrionales bacterium]
MVFLMVTVVYASDDCDSLFKQVLDAEKKLYSVIEKTWPVFDATDENLSLMTERDKLILAYKRNCFDHYTYPSAKFMEKQSVLRLNLGYYDGEKIKVTTAPGFPFVFFMRERHPEAVIAYLKPDSVKVKSNKIELRFFEGYSEMIKQQSYCTEKKFSLKEYTIACGEILEKTFSIPALSIVQNGQSLNDDDKVKFPNGEKSSVSILKYLLGMYYISYDIVSWFEKEMIPRGYLKPVSPAK